MACTTVANNFDIEDVLLDKNVDADKIRENLPMYKEMIHTIYKWMKTTLTEDPQCNIRGKFNRIYGSLTRKYRIYVKKCILVWVYRQMITNGEIDQDPIMWILIQKRPVRNLSGVTVITVLTSPYPDGQSFSCKHNCYYCPNEPDMPRSYLKKEPAVARGFRNHWNAQLQMEDRLKTLVINGHEIDKLEIIIEGGTYTEYPVPYLERFHRDLIYTANTYFDNEPREKLPIAEEIQLNATAKARIIGICIETRPDALYDEYGQSWLPRFRAWGVTRIQLGVQHTDNEILRKINRGHTIEKAEEAITYLKDNCFKIDIHLMPDLPGSSPEKDKEMFDYVFRSPNLQPDQVKIYPCEVVPWTVIKKWHDSGKFKPYAQTKERALLDVVKYAMEICPPWIRLPRIVRDIPLPYIEGGNKYPNLRQMLYDEMEQEGKISMDIRVRECGRHPTYKRCEAGFVIRCYMASGEKEYFISYESHDRKCLFGFIRLRLPRMCAGVQREFPVLTDEIGLIRELHVYGNVVPVGHYNKLDNQHQGIGWKLLKIAELKAQQDGCIGVAVISGIGVVNYYKKFGYIEKDTFMVKYFPRNHINVFMFCIIMAVFIAYYYLLV